MILKLSILANMSKSVLILSNVLTHGQYAVFGEYPAYVPRAWIRILALSLQDRSHKVCVAQVGVEAGFGVVLDDSVEDELFEERLRCPIGCEVLVLLLLSLLARLLLALLPLLADFPFLTLVALCGLGRTCEFVRIKGLSNNQIFKLFEYGMIQIDYLIMIHVFE